MKARLFIATGVVAAAGLAGAGGASAITAVSLAPSVTTTKAAGGNDNSNGADNGIHDTRKQETFACNDDGTHTLVYDGPKDIWPPNHKYRNLTITANGHSDDNVTIAVVPNHDEYTAAGEELNGSGNTDNDAVDTTPAGADMGQGSAAWSGKVRGERSGRGDGRTYSFDVTATFDDDTEPCMHTFTATVPHDQRNHTNSGPKKASGKSLSRKRAKRLALKRAR